MNKQYMLIFNDEGLQTLGNLLKPGSFEFLELQGLNFNNENKYNILVTPFIHPVNPAFTPLPTENEAPVTEEESV